MTQVQVAEATGLTGSTVQNLESARYGKGFSRMPGSARILAQFFGWSDRSVKDILAGGEPAPAQPVTPVVSAPTPVSTPQEPVFRDPRYQAILDSSLPYAEKEQMIRDLVEADLRRARGQRGDGARDAG